MKWRNSSSWRMLLILWGGGERVGGRAVGWGGSGEKKKEKETEMKTNKKRKREKRRRERERVEEVALVDVSSRGGRHRWWPAKGNVLPFETSLIIRLMFRRCHDVDWPLHHSGHPSIEWIRAISTASFDFPCRLKRLRRFVLFFFFFIKKCGIIRRLENWLRFPHSPTFLSSLFWNVFCTGSKIQTPVNANLVNGPSDDPLNLLDWWIGCPPSWYFMIFYDYYFLKILLRLCFYGLTWLWVCVSRAVEHTKPRDGTIT